MEVLKDGTFTDSISGDELAKGLRTSEKAARNTKFLIECVGGVGIDGIMQVIDDLESNRIDTSALTGGFPYPQIFIFPNIIIVCDEDTIYEYDGAALSDVIGPVTIGNIWTVVGIHDFVYLSNGEVAIVRSPTSGIYELVSDQPVAEALCNYNGQILAGGIYE